MKALILLGALTALAIGCAHYNNYGYGAPYTSPYTMRPNAYSAPYTSPYTVIPNAYGLGVNADEYGRPHTYRLQDGTPLDPIFQDGVQRNGYGLGVHQDQFGRPVYDSSP